MSFTAWGCSQGEKRKPTFKVTGQLLLNNAPVPHASIVLHPSGESAATDPKPRGKTDAQGNFNLTTYESEDGAPAGNYQVTVEQWLTTNPEEGPKNKLSPKLSKPETSQLSVTITQEPNQTLKLELSKK